MDECKFKQFKKNNKKLKRELMKAAKEFQPFDFGYLDEIVFKCVKFYYNFYKDPDLLYQDIEDEHSEYNKWFPQLEIANNMVNLLESEYLTNTKEEYTVRRKLYETIAKYSGYWWD